MDLWLIWIIFFNQNALKFYFTNYTDFDNSQNNKIKG